MKQLTHAQTRVLDALRQRAERGDPPPTYRELCRELGFRSTGTIRDHLRALARKGFVELTTRHRNILLRESRLSAGFVPLVGRVAAGLPVISEQNVEGHVPVPKDWIAGRSLFALRVTGDSMRDAGVLEGDQVIVCQAATASNGEIVVATIDGETTLKRLGSRNCRPTLFAENPAYRPIELTGDSEIQGVVVGLVRSYLEKRVDRRISRRGS